MRGYLLLGCGLVGLLVLGLIMAFGSGQAAATIPPTYVPTVAAPVASGSSAGGPGQPDPKALAPSPVIGAARLERPTGAPAIQPSITPPVLGQAVFTVQDVINYVLANGVQGVRFVSNGPVVVEQVEFLASREVDARLHSENGQADDTLLCLVTVRGDFTLFTPIPGRATSFTAAVLVFDARTGNLFQQGQAPPTP